MPPMSVLLPGVAGISLEDPFSPQAEASIPFPKTTAEGDLPATSRSALAPPKRPESGRAGQKSLVRANHFLVKLKPGASICQYDVDIVPKVSSRAIARRLERQLISMYQSEFGGKLPVYDGSKGLYTAGALPFEHQEFSVVLPNEKVEKTFKISLRHVATLDGAVLNEFLQGQRASAPQEHLQALDVALRESPTLAFTPVSRSFFTRELGSTVLEGGLTAWNGFFQSLRPTGQGLVVNVDLATTAFYESIPVIEYLGKKFRQFNPRAPLNDATRTFVKKALVRLRIEVLHRQTPRKYRVFGLSPSATKDLKFTLEGGGETGIVEYFRNTYNFEIRFPELPCLQVQASKTSYLPMEVCKICEGQKYVGKLAERQTTDLRALACVKPAEREHKIRSIMARHDGPGSGNFVSSFGMEVSKELTLVHARVLRPPKLKYGNQGAVKEIDPKFGTWNLMSSCVVEGGNVAYWAFVSFDNAINFQAANAFIFGLTRRCHELGLGMSQQTIVPPVLCRRDDLDGPRLEGSLRHVCGQASQAIQASNPRGRLQLLVCVMGDRHAAYGELKRICETQLGVVTQCCLTKHVRQLKSQYLANLALKINAKVGGRNNTLAVELPQMCPIFNRPAIIFGADVTHPNPGDDMSPSIAAVVANNDWPSAIRYVASVRSQGHREEMIENLKDMVEELWHNFREKTGFQPERIIMFRDGVSEGQFDRVLQYEVTALKEAMLALGGPDYKPRITWVIVQKRHHTRLFPADHNKDRSNNIVPGTVVDTTITHPREFDFYLCSHAGIQGTSKPTHYHVLWDENGFSSDDLQALINNLCYTYVRCTRSVSVVPPAYYAHLAAYRARLYIEAQGGSDTTSLRGGQTSSVGSGGKNTRSSAPPVRPLPPIQKNVQEVMYFC